VFIEKKCSIMPLLIFLVLFNSGCTINHRYHFGGFNVRMSAGYSKHDNKRTVDKGNGKLCQEKTITNSTGIKQQELNLTNNIQESIVPGGFLDYELERKNDMKEWTCNKLIRNENSASFLEDKNYTSTNNLTDEVKSLRNVSYVDTTDPELWAIVFLVLGLVLGGVSLLSPVKLLGPLAILLLLIGVLCAALCEGDFYYVSTKILAILSSIILVLWGGVNTDFFDF
jgi:hypothetical protein